MVRLECERIRCASEVPVRSTSFLPSDVILIAAVVSAGLCLRWIAQWLFGG